MIDVVEVILINTNYGEINNDKSTKQVLPLPRKFCLIDLKNDQIIQNDNKTVNDTISVTIITVPKLPSMVLNNVAVGPVEIP